MFNLHKNKISCSQSRSPPLCLLGFFVTLKFYDMLQCMYFYCFIVSLLYIKTPAGHSYLRSDPSDVTFSWCQQFGGCSKQCDLFLLSSSLGWPARMWSHVVVVFVSVGQEVKIRDDLFSQSVSQRKQLTPPRCIHCQCMLLLLSNETGNCHR